MSNFLYFIPKPNLSDPPECIRYAFESTPSVRNVSGAGPDGKPGTLFSCNPAGMGVFPDKQQWEQIPGEDAWLGWYPEAPPSESSLQRTEQLKGHSVKLLDGGQWLVPVARGLSEVDGEWQIEERLPRALKRDADGKWCYAAVSPKYERLWELATQFWDAYQQDLPFSELVDMCCEALSFNYRISAAEVSALTLFDEDNAVAVARAAMDLPSLEDAAKKKTKVNRSSVPETSNSNAGGSAATQLIGQP